MYTIYICTDIHIRTCVREPLFDRRFVWIVRQTFAVLTEAPSFWLPASTRLDCQFFFHQAGWIYLCFNPTCFKHDRALQVQRKLCQLGTSIATVDVFVFFPTQNQNPKWMHMCFWSCIGTWIHRKQRININMKILWMDCCSYSIIF